MEFDDHEDREEEMEEEMPVTPRFATVVAANSSSGRPTKMGPTSSGELLPSSFAQPQTTTTTNSRKSGSAGGPVRYRECLKNHAVGMGGHAVDGCGDFMAAGEEGTLDALKCAACNCHRNFHRKENPEESGNTNSNHNNIQLGGGIYQPPPAHHHLPSQFSAYYQRAAPPPPISGGYLHIAPQRPLALPANSGGVYSRDEDDVSNPSSSGGGGGGSGGGGVSGGSSKKRFRTKFTQEQKDKMLAFAETLGWRIQKHDDAAVEAFCADTGLKRQVLKVWMHNNKHTLGKKP